MLKSCQWELKKVEHLQVFIEYIVRKLRANKIENKTGNYNLWISIYGIVRMKLVIDFFCVIFWFCIITH